MIDKSNNVKQDTIPARRDAVVRELHKTTEWTRDALPYTADFDSLWKRFSEQTGESPGKHQFWRMLSNAAKSGGRKGKNRGELAPDLSFQQEDILRSIIAGKLGNLFVGAGCGW